MRADGRARAREQDARAAAARASSSRARGALAGAATTTLAATYDGRPFGTASRREQRSQMLVACAVAVAVTSTASFPRRDMSTASFPHYPTRDVFSLSGDWQFEFVNGNYLVLQNVLPLYLSHIH